MNICGLMLIPFGLIYHPISNKQFGAGYSCNVALHLFFNLCVAVVLVQSAYKLNFIVIRVNRNILYTSALQVVGIYIIGSYMMIHFVGIEGAKQTSFHQEMVIDGVQVREESFFGVFERNKSVIADGIRVERDHYRLDCYDYRKEYEGMDVVEWYGLCLTGLESEWISYFDKLMMVSVGLMLLTQVVVFTHINQSIAHRKEA